MIDDLYRYLSSEPTVHFAARHRASTQIYETWYRPQAQVQDVVTPLVARMAADIMSWTGWSQRTLARVVGTTHTTIRSLAAGRSLGPRSHDVRRRLSLTHSLLSRLRPIDGQRPEALKARLELPSTAGPSAMDLLAAGDVAEAYVVALRTPAQTSGTLIQPQYRVTPGAATVSLVDDDSE